MKTINVLQFISPTGFYGAERWILALANNLKADDIRCDLVVTNESINQNLEILHHFPVDEGKTFEISLNSRFDISAISKLCKVIQEREIQIIHTHGYKSDIIGLIAAKITGIKSISTPHGFGEAKDLKLKLYISFGRFILKYFNKVVPLSQQLIDELEGLKIAKSKLAYIQNGVDLKEVDELRGKKSIQASSNNTADTHKTIGFIGQMIPRKKITHILDTFNKSWLKDRNIRLVLVGDGVQRNDLEQYAKTLDSTTCINFLGFRKDRLMLLSQFDLFVMTSSSEGIPRCLMEAMAMEVPVAAYEIPGIDQLITHGKTGLLSNYGDIEQLSKHWLKILNTPDYAKTMGSAARRFVIDNFSAARMAREYTEIYRELVE